LQGIIFMLIGVTTGHETFTNPSFVTKIGCAFRTTKQSKPISFMDACRDPLTKVSQRTKAPVCPASLTNLNKGAWYINSYDVPEGSVVEVKVERTSRGREAFGGRVYASVVLLMRETAAHNRLEITLGRHPDASTSVVYYEGRFDVIEPEMFKDLGINIKGEDNYSEKHRESFIITRQIEPQIKPLNIIRPDIIRETKDGKQIRLITKKKRKLNIRG
jgi:hypothetical protein